MQSASKESKEAQEHGGLKLEVLPQIAASGLVSTPGALTHQLSSASIDQNFHLNENYAHLNAEYLKRRYKRRHENPEKINQLLADYNRIVSNLVTAVEGKMDVAAIGVLHEIIVGLDAGNNESTSKSTIDSGDRQRALFKCNICPILINVLKELGGQPTVCEKTLTCIAYLCRYSDENKTSSCLENAKGFGLSGVSELIVGAIKLHRDDKKVLEAACDAMRCLCGLESNRERLGAAGACEVAARALVAYMNDANLVCWICRVIGHLANNNDHNREVLGSSGACENTVNALQKYPGNLNVCVEACWAMRQLSLFEDNRSRFANDFAPESLMAVFKNHHANEVFAVESSHALVNLIASDEDDLIPRVENSGFIQMSLKTLKKNPDSEVLARWVYNMLYFIACDDRFVQKILRTEVLDILSLSFENHASFEGMAEWGCRFVHVLAQDENALSRMRNAGMCEMVPSAVQRQSISKVVSSVGCLAIGDLARDPANLQRLSQAGACEAAVQALKRHNAQVDVCYNSCYAIHFLSKTQNNISWMGAYGACEAVTTALIKHHESSEEVAMFASNAMGSLAYKDEGNQQRFSTAGACKAITDTLRTRVKNPQVAENACRAIYNLSAENVNVKDLGNSDACGLVVMALQEHASKANVVTQALLAVAGLAVKSKSDKVHKGNTRKLVEKGAIEIIVTVMQKFQDREDVQRAAGMAIASLGRLENNRNKFGSVGACELISNALQLHIASHSCVTKLASAVDVLSTNSVANKGKFSALKTVENLLFALNKHEKNVSLVIEVLKSLVNLSSVEGNKNKIFTESTFKLYVRVMKLHEKNDIAAWWSCTIIANGAVGKENLVILGHAKACENVTNVLGKHGEANANVAQWGCNCIVALSILDENKEKFFHFESCNAIVKALKAHYQNTLVAQFGTASIAALAVFEQNWKRLAQAKASAALCVTLAHQNTNENIIRFTCEAISELAADKENQKQLNNDGVCDILVNLYIQHANNADIAGTLLHSIGAVAFGQPDTGNKFIDLGFAEHIMKGFKKHAKTSASYAEYVCSAMASIVGKTTKNQTLFSDLNAIEALNEVIRAHKQIRNVMTQALRALRILAANNKDNQMKIAKHEFILPSIMDLLNIHVLVPAIVEHGCWLLGTIEYKPVITSSSSSSSSNADGLVSTVTTEVQPGGIPPPLPMERVGSDLDIIQPTNLSDLISIQPQPPSIPPIDSTAGGSLSNSAKAVTPTRDVVGYEIAKQFYGHSDHWDLLLAALRTHSNRANAFRCICLTITMFSSRGKLAHMSICQELINVLEKHVDDEYQLYRILEAIGSLAKNHPMNRQKLSDDNICEIIDSIISGYTEGSVIIQGLFQAIAGLSENNSENQDAFNLLPHTCEAINTILYNELETDAISQYGCAAISALVKNHTKNQMKLGTICNYIADILTYHKNNVAITTEACRAVSYLAHKNFSNRNRLGSSDVCSSIMLVILPNIEEQMNISWRKYDTTLIYWVIKAIGDIAANNPNNQAKLGSAGACEFLVQVLDRKSLETHMQYDAKVLSNVLWAIGNLVQLGKGSSMIIQDVSSNNTNSGNNNGNSNLFGLSGPLGGLGGDGQDSPIASGAGNNNNNNNLSNNNLLSPGGNFGSFNFNNLNSPSGGGGGGGAGNAGGGAAGPMNLVLFQTKIVKNTTRFFNAKISEKLKKLIYQFIDYPDVMLWSSRAIHNLAKSQTLKLSLLDNGLLDALLGICQKYSRNNEIMEWANLAKESLTAPAP